MGYMLCQCHFSIPLNPQVSHHVTNLPCYTHTATGRVLPQLQDLPRAAYMSRYSSAARQLCPL